MEERSPVLRWEVAGDAGVGAHVHRGLGGEAAAGERETFH